MAKRDPLLTELERLVFSDLNKRKNVKKPTRKKSLPKRRKKTRSLTAKGNTLGNRKGKSKTKNTTSKNKKSIPQIGSGKLTRRIAGIELSRFRSKDSEEKKPNCLRLKFTKRASFK